VGLLRSDDEFTVPEHLDDLVETVMVRGRARRWHRRGRHAVVVLMVVVVAAAALPGGGGQGRADHRQDLEPPMAAAPDARAGGEHAVRTPLPTGGRGVATAPSPSGPRGVDGSAPTASTPRRIFGPDRIAFVSEASSPLGDIYVHDAATHSTVQLTTHPSVDTWPSWSPDGRHIAFYSDREGANAVYVVDADGHGERRVTAFGAGVQAYQPAWSPDGRWIAFTYRRSATPHVEVEEAGASEIWVVRPDGSDSHRMLAEGAHAAWAPSGRLLAYVVPGALRVADLDRGTVRTVFWGFTALPSWSPDSGRLVFQGEIDGRAQLHVVNADGTQLRRLLVTDEHDIGPSWSPDGLRIAFRHDPDGGPGVWCEDFVQPASCNGPGAAPGQLWVVEVAGGAPRPLIAGRVADDLLPRFAP
jgi:TolB protein